MAIGDDVYSGAAGFGRFYTTMTAVISTIVGLLLFAVGIYIIYHRSHLKTVNGQVLDNSKCNTTVNQNNGQYVKSCLTHVGYNVDNIPYDQQLNSGSNEYSKGQGIIVYYDPVNPKEAEINPIPKWIGYFVSGLALLIIIWAWVWVWITKKYKFAAAAKGTAGAIEMAGFGRHN